MNHLKFILLLTVGFGGLFVSARQIIEQDRERWRYVAVQGQVDSCSLSPVGKQMSSVRVLTVRFHFDFAGRHYGNANLTPYSTTVDADKAPALQRKYAQGAPVTVLVDRDQPQSAVLFLDQRLAFYWLLAGSFFPTVIGAGGLLEIIRPRRQTMELAARVDADGFREVRCGKTIVERRNANVLLLIAAVVLDLTVSIDVLRAHGPVSDDGMVLLACLAVPVLLLIIAQWRIRRLSGAITQPRVFIQPVPIQRGAPLQIRVEVQARRPLGHLRVRAWLLCVESSLVFLGRRTVTHRSNVVEYVAAEQEQSGLTGGDVLGFTRRLTISAGTPASGATDVTDATGYPNYRWCLHLELTGARNYITNFPLRVG